MNKRERKESLEHNVFTYLRQHYDDAKIIQISSLSKHGKSVIDELRKKRLITHKNKFAEGSIISKDTDTGETVRTQLGFDAFELKWAYNAWELKDAVLEFEKKSSLSFDSKAALASKSLPLKPSITDGHPAAEQPLKKRR